MAIFLLIIYRLKCMGCLSFLAVYTPLLDRSESLVLTSFLYSKISNYLKRWPLFKSKEVFFLTLFSSDSSTVFNISFSLSLRKFNFLNLLICLFLYPGYGNYQFFRYKQELVLLYACYSISFFAQVLYNILYLSTKNLQVLYC